MSAATGRRDRERVDHPLSGISQRLLPANRQAEEAMLGAILANNRAFERVCDIVEPEHFADPVNAMIYARIRDRLLEGRLVDAVTLKNDLANDHMLEEVGGLDYLTALLSSMVGIINAGEYAQAIRDCWMRRQLVDVGESIVNRAFGENDVEEQIGDAERGLWSLGNRRVGATSWTIGAAVQRAVAAADSMHRGDPSPALKTGIATVDRAIGGIWPDDLTILAGIPGAGKTSLAIQIGYSVAQRAFHAALAAGATEEQAQRAPGVAMFSLEMSSDQLGAKIAAYAAGVPLDDVLNGNLDFDVAARLSQAERDAKFLPFRGYDCRSISKALLGARIRQHLRRQPELLIIVDHLLVVEGDTTRQNEAGLNAALVGQTSRSLKRVAWEEHVPMLVLSHATRASAGRVNPRPLMGDLKWAGEGDCDTLLFVHRPIMFDDGSAPVRKKREGDDEYAMRKWRAERDREKREELAEIVVAKRRMGRVGVHRMRFHGPTTSFHAWRGDD